MKAKRTLIKSIALILVLFTVFTTLLSCAADNGLGGESSGSGSESENESSNTPDVEYDIGEDGEDGDSDSEGLPDDNISQYSSEDDAADGE